MREPNESLSNAAYFLGLGFGSAIVAAVAVGIATAWGGGVNQQVGVAVMSFSANALFWLNMATYEWVEGEFEYAEYGGHENRVMRLHFRDRSPWDAVGGLLGWPDDIDPGDRIVVARTFTGSMRITVYPKGYGLK